ncbi:MAG: carbon-nitrogen hydrolase family protein [Fimbriimonadaceae bacterium]|nr:carbon-nitrogen hydrolase family protein [Fimbriimonadaceae bacterium]
MKLACVQADVAFGDPAANAAFAAAKIRELGAQGVELTVFPEAFLTGYCVDDADDARRIALPRLGTAAANGQTDAALAAVQRAAEESDVLAVVGFAEIEGDALYNSAVLFEPGRDPRYYRKTHLPELGYDHHVTIGDRLEVLDTRLGRIGILICFDIRPPEAMRVLALQGAELVVLPTNWPEGAQAAAELFGPVRAAESRVWYAACDRVGTENGVTFIGMSQIVTPDGVRLGMLGAEPGVLVADIDLADARRKRVTRVAGKYEHTVFASRRPELYGPLVEPVGDR